MKHKACRESAAGDGVESTKNALGLHNSCGVVILLNQGVEILSPDVVVGKISYTLLKRNEDGEIRCKNVAYVLVMAESNQLSIGPVREGLPLVLVEGPAAAGHASAENYLDDLSRIGQRIAASLFTPLASARTLRAGNRSVPRCSMDVRTRRG